MARLSLTSEFLQYLARAEGANGEHQRLPSLEDLSRELGVSVPRLREQLEVAKALGLVDVRPRTGIRRLPYTFAPAVQQSLNYAIELNRAYFEAFSELRNHLESAFWYEATALLTPKDIHELQSLIQAAWGKLHSPQVEIPHPEHRLLHLGIYRRLNNPFVQGILDAYWQAYEAVGLNMYADYEYLQKVWNYHQQMVEAISVGDFEAGYRALVEHKDLLYHRPIAASMKDGAEGHS